jgi:hypothetical protein
MSGSQPFQGCGTLTKQINQLMHLKLELVASIGQDGQTNSKNNKY